MTKNFEKNKKRFYEPKEHKKLKADDTNYYTTEFLQSIGIVPESNDTSHCLDFKPPEEFKRLNRFVTRRETMRKNQELLDKLVKIRERQSVKNQSRLSLDERVKRSSMQLDLTPQLPKS